MKFCISGIVLGRKSIQQRSGMIFWAYDLGEKVIARELLQFITKLLMDRIPEEEVDFKTEIEIKNEIELCHQLDDELHLGIIRKVNTKNL